MFDESVPGSLAETLTELCRDDDLRHRLSIASRETIDRLQLTWEWNAKRVVGLLNPSVPQPKMGKPS